MTLGALLTPVIWKPSFLQCCAVSVARSPPPEALKTFTETALLARGGAVVVVVVAGLGFGSPSWLNAAIIWSA